MRNIGRLFDLKWLVAAVAAMLFVLAMTHIPQERMPRYLQEHSLDKVEHIFSYGLITLLYLLSVKPKAGRWLPLIIAVGLAAIGAVDEITQPFVDRTCSIWDWSSDVGGIALACLVFVIIRLRRPAKAETAADG
jgi:VanZ family protein